MTAFRYVAARPDGGRVRGRLEAESPLEAARVLADRGLFPVAVEPARGRRSWNWWARPARTIATAMQSLAALAEIGVPLHRALDATAELVDGAVREALIRVRERVRQGSTLSAALAEEGDLFPAVTLGLVRAGERGVGLAAGLTQAARQLEHEADTRADVQAALAYPAFLLLVGSLSVALILLVVLPRFAALLTDVQGSLPAMTRAVLASSQFLREHGPAVAIASAVTLVAAAYLAGKRREAWASWLLELPVIGPIRHGLATARVSRALGALLGTGVSALQALAVAREAAGDAEVARRLEAAAQRIAEGSALGDALAAAHALTPGAIQLVRIGERSGRLAELLDGAAALEERAASRRLHALVTALEPALIVAFALLVALTAGALLQALYSVRPGAGAL